jgi:iron complex transport system permease protein
MTADSLSAEPTHPVQGRPSALRSANVRVTLDLTDLLRRGEIDQAEFDKLKTLGARGASALAFGLLIGFGVVAVSLGLIALIPDALTGIVVGVPMLSAGLVMYRAGLREWEVLAHILVLVGALTLGGGIAILGEASGASFLLIVALFGAAGIAARSSLLVVLAVMALSASLGAWSAYSHATYTIGIAWPAVTVVVFGALALGAYHLSKHLADGYDHLALMAARAAVFVVNFGFWIGSLWGDEIEPLGIVVDRWVFVLLWAAALLATGLWAARVKRRWVINVVAVFGAIHFYTQWFERLGAAPLTVLLAGLIALGLALALWHLNRRPQAWRPPRPFPGD